MPRVEFAGQSVRDNATTGANPTRLVNLYREPTGDGYVLRSVPGMAAWADLGTPLMRDLQVVGASLYAAAGGRLWKIRKSGSVIDCGAIGNETETNISSNGGAVLVASGGVLRVYQDATLTETAVAPFSDIGSVAYCGNYSIVTELHGKRLAWSDLADPTTWPGLNFATAGIVDEDIVRAIVLSDVVFIFGATSCERWSVTGQADANAFARINGGNIDIGLPYYACIARFPGGFGFVGSNGTVNLWLGDIVAIGTPAVNAAIAANTPRSMLYYEARGHGFLALTFTDRPAWVYDMATKEWHERAEEQNDPWSARASAFFDGAWRVGSDLGAVARLSPYCEDLGAPLIRRVVGRRFRMDKPGTLALVEAFPRKGTDDESVADLGLYMASGDGEAMFERELGPVLLAPGWDSGPAKIGLRVSGDGGKTFSHLRLRDVGERGDYANRVTWRALGWHRSVTVEFSLSSIFDVPLEAAAVVEIA